MEVVTKIIEMGMESNRYGKRYNRIGMENQSEELFLRKEATYYTRLFVFSTRNVDVWSVWMEVQNCRSFFCDSFLQLSYVMKLLRNFMEVIIMQMRQ